MATSIFSQIKRNPYEIVFKAMQFIGPVAGVSLIIGMASTWYLQNSPQQLPIKYKLITPEHTFYLESASTPEQLYKGLKFRSSLPSDRGMLFDLGKRQTHIGFWMYLVSIPLDIIYLDNGVVTKVVHAPPCPKEPCPVYYAPRATHVLELPSRVANIRPGMTLQFFTVP